MSTTAIPLSVISGRTDADLAALANAVPYGLAVPFGGRKHSGFGRELGEEALEPYLTSKSVWVDLQSGVAQAGQAISR